MKRVRKAEVARRRLEDQTLRCQELLAAFERKNHPEIDTNQFEVLTAKVESLSNSLGRERDLRKQAEAECERLRLALLAATQQIDNLQIENYQIKRANYLLSRRGA